MVYALCADLSAYSNGMKGLLTSMLSECTRRKTAEELLQLPVMAALPEL